MSTSQNHVTKNRKRAEGYIPRPPNSFMLFRSECCKLQREGKLVVKTSQQDISKVAAEIWATLPVDQKDYWVQMAKLAEAEHKNKHPGYTYKPSDSHRKATLEQSSMPAGSAENRGAGEPLGFTPQHLHAPVLPLYPTHYIPNNSVKQVTPSSEYQLIPETRFIQVYKMIEGQLHYTTEIDYRLANGQWESDYKNGL